MKKINWWLIGFMEVVVLILTLVVGAVITYAYMLPSTYPETEYKVEVVTVPVDRVVEKIVTKEVILTPTPMPTPQVVSIPMPVVTEEPTPVPEQCVDAAWVVNQPRDDLLGSALKAGTIKRLHFRIRNEGTCIWDGYMLTSGGVMPDIQMPYTMPGEIADFTYDFQVYKPMEIRWVVRPPNKGALMLANSASPGAGLETIYYRLDVYQDTSFRINVGGGGQWRCDSFG